MPETTVRAFPTGRIDQEALLELLRRIDFEDLVVIGILKDGGLYMASTTDLLRDINAVIDAAKFETMVQIRENIEK